MEKTETSAPESAENGDMEIGVSRFPYLLLACTALSVFISEVLVMLILELLPPMSLGTEAFLDGLLLTIFIFPFLYLLMVRPMIRQIQKRHRAEMDLQQANQVLEDRVRLRTAEIKEKNESLTIEVENRRRAELSAQENEAFLLQVVETLPALMWVVDLEKGRCIFVNSRIEETLGYTPEQIYMMGDRFVEELFASDNLGAAAGLGNQWKLSEEGEVTEGLGRLVHANGHELEFRIRAVVLERREDQTPSSILCTVEKRPQGEK